MNACRGTGNKISKKSGVELLQEVGLNFHDDGEIMMTTNPRLPSCVSPCWPQIVRQNIKDEAGIGFELSKELALDLFELVDKDNSGTLDFREFRTLMMHIEDFQAIDE
jgi:hypothetical protein